MAQGEWVWGHDSGVTEDFSGDLADGTGTGQVEGSGDGETLGLTGDEWQTYGPINIGTIGVVIEYDQYASGSGTPETIEYKTGNTRVTCEADSWNAYTVHFESLGWVKVRMRVSGRLKLSTGDLLLLDDGSSHLTL